MQAILFGFLTVIYRSLRHIMGQFLGLQCELALSAAGCSCADVAGDSMLCETGFLATLLAFCPSNSVAAALVLAALRVLLFRLMFASGLCKVGSRAVSAVVVTVRMWEAVVRLQDVVGVDSHAVPLLDSATSGECSLTLEHWHCATSRTLTLCCLSTTGIMY